MADVADVVLEGLGIFLDRGAVPAQFARSGDQKTGQNAQQARFAAAVGTAQDQRAAFRQREFQRGKNAPSCSIADEVSSFECRHIGGVGPAGFGVRKVYLRDRYNRSMQARQTLAEAAFRSSLGKTWGAGF